MAISLLKVNEPRLDIQPDRMYLTHVGATNITTRPYNADSISDSQITWAITTPSVRVGVDRRIDMDITFDIGCTGTAANAANLLQMNAGIRQYPVHASSETMNCRLNDQSFSWEPNEIIHGLLSYGNDVEDRQHFMSATPHKPDIFWSYDQTGIYAGTRNPLSTFFNSGEEDSRNLYFLASVQPADARFPQSFVRVRVIETLMMSPFYWGKNSHQCLFGIQNLELTIIFNKLLRMICGTSDGWVGASGIFNGNGNINNLVVKFPTEPSYHKLHISFLTPQPDVTVPSLLHYPYYAIKTHKQELGEVAAGTTQTFAFNNISLHEIPKRAYIFIQPKKYGTNTVVVTNPDFFARINTINMNFDNVDGRFSSLDSYDLCKLSQKNGLKRSWLEWNKTIGSVLCFEFGTDVTLSPLCTPGVRGNFQLSYEINFSDLRTAGAALEYRAFLVLVPEGVMSVENSLVSISVGALTEQDIASAEFARPGTRLGISSFTGSGFWDLAKRGWNVAKKILPFAGPVMRGVSTVANLIPHPYGKAVGKVTDIGAKVMGSGSRKKKGGKLLRTNSLASRI